MGFGEQGTDNPPKTIAKRGSICCGHLTEGSIVDYNVELNPGEIDVVGVNLDTKTIYVCEVVTHTQGLGYIDNRKVIRSKFERGRYTPGSTLRISRSPICSGGWWYDKGRR